jgi:hypothetical protein
MIKTIKNAAVLAAALAILGAFAAPAWGAAGDPLFVFVPTPPLHPEPGEKPTPPPLGYLNDPCGLAVDSSARFFVSDYYHHAADVYSPPASPFSAPPSYVTQLPNEDLVDGPCGLAFDASNNLYVNNYHRNVVRFSPSPSFGVGTAIAGAPLDSSHPTGVSVDSASGTVYVDQRTYVSAYDSSAGAVIDGAEPLKIGLGTLGDGYGVAISQFPGTVGRLYVPDASTNTVKVYDPAVDKVNPVAELESPAGGPFLSLRDSAVAVDRVSGDVYFADNTQPLYTERPQATIYVYSATGAYKGHLKYNVVDALPPGLAVDNSNAGSKGRVYVTSGNTDRAGVYAYPPGAATTTAPLPPTQTLAVATSGAGAGLVTSQAAGIECSGTCRQQIPSGAELTLTATPEAGSAFAGWAGAGCTSAGECVVQMDEPTSLSARFEALPAPVVPAPIGVPLSASPAASPGRHRARHHHHHLRRHHHRPGPHHKERGR